jgi:endonuclease YncB( thermonuclease family)
VNIRIAGVAAWTAAVVTLLVLSLPVSAATPDRHPAAAPAAVIEGVVTEVIDAKRLRVTPAGQPAIVVVIRDIDPPEPCQTWGTESRRELESLVLNKAVSVRPASRERSGALLATVMVDQINVGVHQVEEGHAWSIRTHWDRGPLVKQERLARALGRGLFGQGGLMSPQDFRRSNGPCSAPALPVSSPVPATRR